jgi:hypothetical protein
MEFDLDNQYKDTVDRIIDLLQATFSKRFAAYYESDPIQIPTVNLPCVIVEKSIGNATIKGAPTGHDSTESDIIVKIVFNKKDDYGANDDVDLTGRKLRYIVEARDKDTGAWKEGTIVHTLRKHLTLSQEVFENDITWEYGIQPREDSVLTAEAHVLIKTRGVVEVIGRD